ncbi:MAG: hypothetical protein RL885_03870 [Planctomycetota bacterium]
MRSLALKTLLAGAALSVAMVGTASAAQIFVTSDITVDTTWTANNTYNLQAQIYVRNGATLTIEAGTVIASTTNLGGSLAVSRGSDILALGTKDAPIIFTSLADVATWAADGSHPTGGNPKTGTWREAANEWGNLTIMGSAFIAENALPGNVPTCDANNEADMEGLTRGPSTDRYGAGNDDDDSGVLNYVSIRYGGKVVSLNNELNGLSLGGIGRGTDINYVEIMNNVDDGIEVWGGTVNFKHISIWNVGDDSFDIDQGWRGKAQFGLIVQGYSLDASQGSGVGDNAIEHDGAEDSDWQPVTTGVMYNFTVIGQPVSGDGLTAWRDGCRMQHRNAIFMDGGEQILRPDGVDGDGGSGYGFNSTLTLGQVFQTAYNGAPSHPNDCPPSAYQAQSDGNLAEFKECTFYNNLAGNAYTAIENVDGTGYNAITANNNTKEPGTSPVTTITRGAAVTKGGLTMVPVTFLDPRPQGSARNAQSFAPNDGFCLSHKYRGAFAPDGNLWTGDWCAAVAYGFMPADSTFCDIGSALPGSQGQVLYSASGTPSASQVVTFKVRKAEAGAGLNFVASIIFRGDTPILGGVLVPSIGPGALPIISIPADGSGNRDLPIPFPSTTPVGITIYTQVVATDSVLPKGLSFSNALEFKTQ